MRLKHSALTDVRASALPLDQLPVYRIGMKRTAWILTLLLFVCACAAGQNEPNSLCPSISVTGPAGIVTTGEIAYYTADIGAIGNSYNLEFVWSIENGTIVKGQGTKRIGIANVNRPQTVSVEVKGLPSECPNRASETSSWDPPLTPEKLDQFAGDLSLVDDKKIQRITYAAQNNPNSQLYVFVPSDPKVRENFLARLDAVSTEHYFDSQRITFVDTTLKTGPIQIWLVPPGATPPSKCEGCDPPAALPVVTPAPANCPTLEVTGPSGVTARGTIMPFVVLVSEPRLKNLSFAWSVSTGTIAEGQGTRVIKVRAPAANGTKNITATVTVQGLPQGCRNVASGSAEIALSGRLSNQIFAFRH